MSLFAFKEMIQTLWPTKPTFLPSEYPDLTGKIVLVTGTSAGVGKETTRLLLEKNATVVVANRNKSKTDESIKEIINQIRETDDKIKVEDIQSRIISITLDLSDLSTIKPAVEELKQKVNKLDYVILNAGVMQPPNGSVTKQGWELQYGVNVIAHQLLIQLINGLVLKAYSSTFTPRVVFLSSVASAIAPANGGLTWDFKEKDAARASSEEIYGQSKAANYYLANIYGENNKGRVISLAVHPGFLASELMRSYSSISVRLAQKLAYTPVFGAYTELFAALDPKITINDTGKYVAPFGVFRDIRPDLKKGVEDGTARKMWEFNEEHYKSNL